jgi:hypothetical protein
VGHFNSDPSSLGHAVNEHERPRAVRGWDSDPRGGADGIDLLVWAWEIHETSLFELQPERLP